VRKIKIVHVVNDAMGLGGVPKVVYHLLKALPAEHYALSIYSLKSRGGSPDISVRGVNRFKELGLEVHFPDQGKNKSDKIADLCKWLLRNQIDILHTHSYGPNLIGRLAGILCRKIKIVSHYHNDGENKWEKNDDLICDQLLAPFTDRLIACSESVGKHVSERIGVSREKIEVILNGVDLDQFKPCDHLRSLKEEMGLPLDSQVIGIVGRISEEKGQDDFIKAAGLIKKTFPNTIFLIIGQTGNDTLKTRLRALAVAHGVDREVIFTGYIPDVHRVYSALDILVVPSRWEGFGLILVEGMSSGKPIVATNVGAIPEVVLPNETALLVPPSMPSAIASGVIHLLENPEEARRMGEKGRERAKMFSWDRSGIQLDDLYKKLMQESVCL